MGPNRQIGRELYTNNITHNLNSMAEEAGIYKHLWRPEEIGITEAAELIQPLRAAFVRLEAEPHRFEAFNPPNGWGDYAALVLFVEQYLRACEKYPGATIHICR